MKVSDIIIVLKRLICLKLIEKFKIEITILVFCVVNYVYDDRRINSY